MNGKEALEIIEKVAATSSRTEKELILSAALGEGSEFFQHVVRLAYDPFITFGVTWPSTTPSAGTMMLDRAHTAWAILDQLAKRTLTGGSATNTLNCLRASLEPSSWELIRRILNKDLRAGFTENTINRIAPGTIPKFEVMLAHKYEEKRIKEWPVAVEPKLDGVRTLGLIKNGAGKFYSRTGKEFGALAHLGPHVAKMVQNAIEACADPTKFSGKLQADEYFRWLGGSSTNPTVAIDAEVIASASFNKTSGDVRRKSETAETAVLHIFDAVPLSFMLGSERQWGRVAYLERRRFVKFLISCAEKGSPITMTGVKVAKTHEEIQEIYQAHRDAGLEGAMVKPLNGVYVKKRSQDWLKMKASEAEDLIVEGLFEGMGKYEGQMGGIICDFKGVKVRVGGGFSDAQRVEFWNNQGEIIGRMAEVEYHEITPDGSLRHPRFLKWRDDKAPAKDEAA